MSRQLICLSRTQEGHLLASGVLSTLGVLLLSLGLAASAWGQSGETKTHVPTGLKIDAFSSSDDLGGITEVLLGEGLIASDIKVQSSSDATVFGPSLPAFGAFSNGLDGIGIDSGLIVSANAKVTGFADAFLVDSQTTTPEFRFRDYWAINPNAVAATDPQLNALLGCDPTTDTCTQNVTSVEFTLVPTDRYLKFEYVLAVSDSAFWDDALGVSGAWDDLASGVLEFADGFGLFVDDENIGEGPVNYAIRPGTNNTILTVGDAGIARPANVDGAGSFTSASSDRAANRAIADANLTAWRQDPSNFGDGAEDIFYFNGSRLPNLTLFDDTFCSIIPDNVDFCQDSSLFTGYSADIDWSVSIASVPITVVHDTGLTSFTDAKPITVRILIADNGDTNAPPAVFLASESIRFESTDTAERSLRITLNSPADTHVGAARTQYQATLKDSIGNSINAGTNITLSLSTAPAGGAFYAAATGGSPITTINIPAGSSQSADFYFEASTAASYTVIARSTLPTARDAIIVEAGASSEDVANALAILTTFSPDNPTEPSADDYETIGVTLAPLTSNDVPGINTIIKGLNAEDRDTAEKIQNIVNVYGDIKTNADGNPANEPGLSVTEISLLGLPTKETPFTPAQADLYNELLGARQPEDVDTLDELKAISDVVIKVFGTREDAAYTPKMTVSDFEVLGVTGVTEDNLPAVIKSVGPPVGSEDASSVANIQARVDRGISTFDGNLTAINAHLADNTNPAPNATTYSNIGVTGIPSSIIAGYINEFAQQVYDQEPTPQTRVGLQAIVDLYNEIQTAADGDPATTAGLVAAEFATLALGEIKTDSQVSLANSVLGAAGLAEANTLSKVQALTDISQAIIALTGGAPSNTVTAADLTSIGLTGVTSTNEAAVLAAIAATPSTGQAVDTIPKLQALIDSIVTPPTSTEIEVIITFDPDVDTAPTADDYENAGIFGVNPGNVEEINEIVGEVVDGTPEDEPLTPADIQQAVTTYIEIQTFADGDPATNPSLTAEDYQAMGLSQITSEAAAKLLNDISGARTQTEVDTLAKIKAFADIANAITQLAAGNDVTLSVADLTKIGVTGVTTATLPDVVEVISGSPKDGSLVDSVAEVQTIVTIVTATPDPAAVNALIEYDPTTDPAPGTDTYEDAGIVGVNDANVTTINDLIDKIPSDQPLTPVDIQAIVNAYNEVLSAADGDGTKAGQLTKEQFAILGLVEIDEASETNLLNDIIGSSNPTDVNTYAALTKLANIVTEIIGAAGGSGGDDLTASDFNDIGVIGVTDDNVNEVVDAIGDTPDDGTRVDSVDEIQDIVDATTTDVPDNTVETFVESTSKDVTGYGNAGIAGVDNDNLTTINTWVDATKDTNPDQTGTQAGLQQLVNAVNAVLAGTTSGPTIPASVTLEQFAALGLDEIDTATEQTLMNALIGQLPSSPAPTPETLSTLAGVVSKVSALATGSSTQTLTAAELAALGLSVSTADAVGLLNEVIQAGGSALIIDQETLQKADGAVIKIATAANGSASTQPDLNASDYAALGITLPDAVHVGMMNAWVGGQNGAPSLAGLTGAAQKIARILMQVSGTGPTPALTVADFTGLGITNVSANNLGIVVERLSGAQASDFETDDPIATLQALVDEAVMDYASQAVPVPTLSVWTVWLMMLMALLMGLHASRTRAS